MASAGAAAASLLKRQLKEMQSGKDLPGISCGLVNDNNIFEWEVMLMINDDCKYYGGTWRSLFPFPSCMGHSAAVKSGSETNSWWYIRRQLSSSSSFP
jgi:ubiquitin-conjugating enzyme E2 G1